VIISLSNPSFDQSLFSAPKKRKQSIANLIKGNQMSAYVIAMVNITDPDKYSKYSAKATIASQELGGKFLVRGGDPATLEGALPYQRVVVNQFETREKAVAFYNSMAYQDAKSEREGAADFNMIVVDGVA